MIIHNIKFVGVAYLRDSIATMLPTTRFRAVVETQNHARYGHCINLSYIRLQSRKEFCGNHPDACVVGGKDKKASFLEGADWVEFNDRLNDLLDSMSAEADIFSRPLEIKKPLRIRKGGKRRIAYHSEPIPGIEPWSQFFGATQWVHDDPDVWEDHRKKKAPRSEFPEGTPGIYTDIGYSVVG